jgi:hypothetical protein
MSRRLCDFGTLKYTVVLGNSDVADTVGVAHLSTIFTDSRVIGVVRNRAVRFSNSSGFAA